MRVAIQAPSAGLRSTSFTPLMFAVALVFALTLAWWLLTFPGFGNDHYVHLARAQQMLLGEWPIRDFVDPGMPLMYAVSAAAWRVAGGAIGTEVTVVAAAFALGAAFTFLAARALSGSIGIALLVTLAEVLIAPRSYSYPKILLYAIAAWGIVALARSASTWRIVLLGAFVATAFLFRHDHGLYIGAGAATCVVLRHLAHGPRVIVGRLAILAGAVAVALIPWLLLVARYQGLIDYFTSGIQFSRAEAGRTALSALPRPQFSPELGLVRLQPPYRPAAKIVWADATDEATRVTLERRYHLRRAPDDHGGTTQYFLDDRSPSTIRAIADDPHIEASAGLGLVGAWSFGDVLLASFSPWRIELREGLHPNENSYVWLFYLFHGLPLLTLAVLWQRRRLGVEGRPGEHIALAALVVMAVAANLGLIRGSLNVWLPDAVVSAAVLGSWLLSQAVGRRPSAARAVWITVAGALVLITLVAVAHVGRLGDQIDRANVRGFGGVRARFRDLGETLPRSHRESGLEPSSVSRWLAPFFAYVGRCTAVQDRFMMTSLFPDVFVMAGRGFAGGQLAFISNFYTSTREQERTLERMRRQSVPFVVLLLETERDFRREFPLVSAYIDQRYTALADLPVEQTPGVRVMVERTRAAVRVDADTRWPCFL